MSRNRGNGFRIIVTALALALSASACGFEYDTEWTPPPRGTFGEELFDMIRKELSLSPENANAKVAAFDARKSTFVTALDAMFPDNILRPLHEYFVDQLPLYDDDTLPTFTRKAGAVLRDLADDRAALEVLAKADARLGYDADLAGLMARVTQFPRLKEMMVKLSGKLLEQYGRDGSGQPTGAPDALGRLLSAAAGGLRDFEADRSPDRTGALVADFLLREDDRLAQSSKTYAVRLDRRGVARVATDPATGKLFAPFVDVAPQDGLADVNAQGLPVDQSGQVIRLRPFGADGPRDGTGRLLAATGRPETVFQYVELRKTLLSSLLPDLKSFVEKDVPFKGLRSARALLGSRVNAQRDGETYRGFSGAPLLDLAHGLFAALDSPDLPDALLGLRQVLDNDAPTMAAALREMDRIDEVRDRHPGGGLVAGNSLEDDLLPIVKEIAETPGLFQAVLDAFADPAARGMRAVFGKLLKYKKTKVTESDVNQGTVFTTAVDRSRPDTGTNKSLFQRTMALMWETQGVKYEPEALGIIPLGFIFKVDDLSAFYLDAVAGNVEVPTAVTWVTPLSKRPTPREINRFLNEEQTLMSEPENRYGQNVREVNGDTLFALEAAGGIEALRPLAKAFSDRGKTKLLVKLFATLHLHYASPQSDTQNRSASQPGYSKQSGLVTVEGFLQELLGETPFLDRATDLLVALGKVQVGGRKMGEILAGLVRKLVTPAASLRTRSGADRVTRSSGAVASPLSPWDLIRVGLDGIDAALDADAGAKSAWEQVRKDLVDTLLGTVETPDGVRFQNDRAVVFTSHLLGFLAERIRANLDAGTWSTKLKQDYPNDLRDLVTGPGLAAAVDLFDVIDADAELKELFRSFAVHLLPRDGVDGDRLLRLGAKVLHSLMDGVDLAPLAKFLARVIHPQSGFVLSTLRYFHASMVFDQSDLMRGILQRASDAPVGTKPYLNQLGDVLGSVLRVQPGSDESWSAEDFGQFFGKLSNFLLDKEKGLEKLIKIVKGRK